MLPIFAEKTAAFEYRQTIEMVYRETPHSQPQPEKYTQQGFVLLENDLKGAPPTYVCRLITQYILTPQTMARLRTVPQVLRREIGDEHVEQYFSAKKPFGMEIPMEFTTDLRNGNAKPTGHPKNAIPYDTFHLPSITPALPMEDPAAGKTWNAMVLLKCGFGNFPIAYAAKWTVIEDTTATAEMTFDPQEKAATLEDITLLFRPGGSWTVTFTRATGAFRASKGAVQFVVQGQAKRTQEAAEIINCKLNWEWTSVPLGFTPKFLMTAGWATLKPQG